MRDLLTGHWALERELKDLLTDTTGRFSGMAILRPAQTGLHYEENGTLDFGDHTGQATRRYLVTFDENGRAMFHFEDGRFFHDLDLRTGNWSVSHLCGQDVYEGYFQAQSGGALRVRWHVQGPRKHYLSYTQFRPIHS